MIYQIIIIGVVIVDIKNYVKMIIVKIVLINLFLATPNLNFGIIKKIIKHLDNVLRVHKKKNILIVINVNIKYIYH